MEILLQLDQVAGGYCAQIDHLPNFSIQASTIGELVTRLPEQLKAFNQQWEKQHPAATNEDELTFSCMQRIKARGFYHSTSHRFKTYLAAKPITTLDLELIHTMTGPEFEASLAN